VSDAIRDFGARYLDRVYTPAEQASYASGGPASLAARFAATRRPGSVCVDEGLNGLDVHVAHDPAEPVDLTFAVELLREDGSVIESAERSWAMEPRGHRHWTVDAMLGRFADSSYAYRFGPPPHAAVRAILTGGGSVEREAVWRVPGPTRGRAGG
jgi:beta-mannosidase